MDLPSIVTRRSIIGETNSIRGLMARFQWFLIKVGFGLAAFFFLLLIVE